MGPLIGGEELADTLEEVGLDVIRDSLSSSWRDLCNQIFNADLLQTLALDDLLAVLFELIAPASFNKLLAQ